MSKERKMFTAELQRLKARNGTPGAAPEGGELFFMLEDIKAELRALTGLVKGEEALPPSAKAATAEEVIEHREAEVAMLKTELRALAVCIEQTKEEIAALKPANTDDDRLLVVANELDAIVSATEHATNTILEASEKIDGLAAEIRSHSADGYVARLAEDITETVVAIFEACNFQDITGQRISKVVRTLNYIEGRIAAMIDIWGPENIAEIIPGTQEEYKNEEDKLLNGPQLGDQGISQDEIDKLFG